MLTPALLARMRRQYARYQRTGATLDVLLSNWRDHEGDDAYSRKIHGYMSAMEIFEAKCFCYVKAIVESE